MTHMYEIKYQALPVCWNKSLSTTLRAGCMLFRHGTCTTLLIAGIWGWQWGWTKLKLVTWDWSGEWPGDEVTEEWIYASCNQFSGYIVDMTADCVQHWVIVQVPIQSWTLTLSGDWAVCHQLRVEPTNVSVATTVSSTIEFHDSHIMSVTPMHILGWEKRLWKIGELWLKFPAWCYASNSWKCNYY